MTQLAKVVGQAFRDPDKLTGVVERFLLTRDEQERRSDVIHPSEAAHEDWCHRASYYRIAGYSADPVVTSLAMEMVFERGHDSHRKWQEWFREMGVLRGRWLCLYCRCRFTATSPKACPECHSHDNLLVYQEVPVAQPEYLLAGQMDGEVMLKTGSRLIEIKTIGTGTVRVEAPTLIERWSYSHFDDSGKSHVGVDWYKLWKNIRRPFASHIRQGMLYLFCVGRKEITYLYDPKFLTARPKEFEMGFQQELIEEILERCLEVKRSLGQSRPPKRPMWAHEPDTPRCKQCRFRSTCWDARLRGSQTTDQADPPRSGTRTNSVGISPPRQARVRTTPAPIGSF